jgi:hypothetical protein
LYECSGWPISNLDEAEPGFERQIDMKKLHLIGATLVAVFAVFAFAAASASAVTFLLAEWLVSGLPVTAELSVEGTGELELSETILGLTVAVLCSGVLDGTITTDGRGKVSELLSLTGTAISLTGLSGTGLACTGDSNCGATAEAWAVDLPWAAELVLMEEGTEVFFAGLGLSSGAGAPGWEILCANGTSDTCTATEGVVNATNEGNNVDGTTSEAFTELAGLKLGNCLTAGNEKAILAGLGTLSLVGGATLAVSE